MKIGYFLSTEEYTPEQLIEQARLAEEAGFDALWISDHFHPWNDEQGESPFVWSVIGAISQVCDLPVTTAVTCPTVRTHPAVIAQAAATSAVLLEGRFVLGVGSGEALNEHILGGPWPTVDVRLEMLEEAVEVIRELWTGEVVTHRGRHYTVDNARIYTLPDTPPPIYCLGVRSQGDRGRGPDRRRFHHHLSPTRTCCASSASPARTSPPRRDSRSPGPTPRTKARSIAHRLWANSGLPGELAQVLPSPKHFEQASSLVTEESTATRSSVARTSTEHVAAFTPYADAGFDEVYVANMGPHYRDMIEAYGKTVLPALKDAGSSR